MFESRIKELTEERTKHALAAKALADEVAGKGGEFTGEQRSFIEDAMAKAAAADAGLKAALKDQKAYAQATEFATATDAGETGKGMPGKPQGGRKGSIGAQFVGSEAFKGLMATAPAGGFGEKTRVQSSAAGFGRLLSPAPRAKAVDPVTGGSQTSGGGLFVPDWLGLQSGFAPFFRPLTVRSLVTNGTTGTDTIEYARITGISNNAAPVAESTTVATPGTQNAANGVKPQSGFTTVKVTTYVKTLAHWIAATKRALSDAAQVQTLIDGFLDEGLEEALEDQVMAGDGTGENFEGLANVSGVQVQDYDTDLLTTSRKAMTKARIGGRVTPTGYVINPLDAESFDLLQDGQGRYYFGGPSASGGANPLWGLPVVQSEAVPQGTGWLADWSKAILWDREESSLSVTDSHADFFVRNLVAILAEMRAGFGVIQPSAFVKITLTAPES